MWIYIFIVFAFGWESDNFNCLYSPLDDVSGPLNQEVNRRINEVLTVGVPSFGRRRSPSAPELNENKPPKRNASGEGYSANRGTLAESPMPPGARNMSPVSEVDEPRRFEPLEQNNEPRPLIGCNRTELLSALRGILASGFMANMESWAEDQTFTKCKPSPTIYEGFSPLFGTLLGMSGINSTIQIGSTSTGTDKLSHFMTEGYDYYQKQLEGGSLQDILQIGVNEEEGMYGFSASGVKSYGDMAANYSGYLFWKNLTEGSNPYIRCEGNKWKQVRQFDWNDYINPFWNESVNCSEFVDSATEAAFNNNVRELQRRQNRTPLTCPLNADACLRASEWISDPVVRQSIIHPRCLNAGAPAASERNFNAQ